MRWQWEVTTHRVCTPLGVETQRPWSDLAIMRTIQRGSLSFRLHTTFAHPLLQDQPLPVHLAARSRKALPMFPDTLAFVRQRL